MTLHDASQRLMFQLYHIYDNREAANIADLMMEHITGWKKIDRILNKDLPLLPDKLELLEKYTRELLAQRPLQYVLNEAWFCGMKFYVDENVLIPRPETEELVGWVGESVSSKQAGVKSGNLVLFDVGTGSGCIAIAIKKQTPLAEVFACDVSKKALEVAQKNAVGHNTDIGLLHMDFLKKAEWDLLPGFDFIVSNPPYVPLKDKASMRANVLQYEPHIALFVENDDPLRFYKAIADLATHKLKTNGSIFAEVHEELGNDVGRIFEENGFSNIELRKDMQGRDRMIRIER